MVLAELERHPAATAVLGPVLESDPPTRRPSHAYLFHGPSGAGKRIAARAVAAALLAPRATARGGRGDSHTRALHGTHPDLTWVSPSGAHELLVSDIDEPVVMAAVKTPFESERRVFVIESVDTLGDEAANRMLKTLEEPAAFVHLILITDRLGDVLPTIRSRCQLVRFEALDEDELVKELRAVGIAPETATSYARLGLGDPSRARALATPEGQALRGSAERFVTAAIEGRAVDARPEADLLATVRARGEKVTEDLEERKRAELELVSSKERRRAENEWNDRIRRAKRRAETGALDMALSLVAAWLLDLAALGWGARDLVRNVDRMELLVAAPVPQARSGGITRAVELVEDTRQRLQLNVTEELACEALAYRLQALIAG